MRMHAHTHGRQGYGGRGQFQRPVWRQGWRIWGQGSVSKTSLKAGLKDMGAGVSFKDQSEGRAEGYGGRGQFQRPVWRQGWRIWGQGAVSKTSLKAGLKDMGGGVSFKDQSEGRAGRPVIGGESPRSVQHRSCYWPEYCFKRSVLSLVLKAGREGLWQSLRKRIPDSFNRKAKGTTTMLFPFEGGDVKCSTTWSGTQLLTLILDKAA